MSGLVRTLKYGKDLIFDVRSKLDDALEAMPDQEMPPEDIANGLKNRGVRDIEVKQSGVQDYIDTSKEAALPVNPKAIQTTIKDRGRPDEFAVHEIRGTNEMRPSAELEEEWLELTEHDFGPLTEEHIDKYIADQRDNIGAYDRDLDERIELHHIETQDNINIAESIRDNFKAEQAKPIMLGPEDYDLWAQLNRTYKLDALGSEANLTIENADHFIRRMNAKAEAMYLDAPVDENGKVILDSQNKYSMDQMINAVEEVQAMQAKITKAREVYPQMAASWDDITDDLGYSELSDLTPNNIQQFIKYVEEDIDDVYKLNDERTAEITVAAYKDRVNQAKDIHARLTHSKAREILDKYEFEDYNIEEAYRHLDQYVETVHRVNGPEAAREFEQEMRHAMPGNVFTFPDKAYRDVTLPDTDDASYAVRLYKNPAVKIPDKAKHGHHWQDDENSANYIFHTRTDSPEPEVLRIQEMQSDIQNALTNQKQGAIKRWRNKDYNITAEDIYNNSNYYDDGLGNLGEARLEAVTDYLSTVQQQTGADVATHIEATSQLPLAELSNADIRDYIIDIIADDVVDPTEALNRYIIGLRTGNIPINDRIVIPDNIIEEFASSNPDLTEQQIEATINLVNDFKSDMFLSSDKAMKAGLQRHIKATALRVTPEERLIRAKSGIESTVEEKELRRNAIKAGVDSVNEDYGLKLKIHNKTFLDRPGTSARIMSHLTEQGLIADFADRVLFKLEVGGKKFSTRSARIEAQNHIEQRTTQGLSYVDEAYPQIGDPNVILNEVRDVAKAAIEKDIDKLTPLEKFPNAKDFELPISWIKQGYQEEFLKAIETGKKEVWLNVNAEGTAENLARGQGPQANYESGALNKQFRSIAKRFKADLVEEDGYLKAKIGAVGAGVVAIPAYADTNTQDKIQRALDENVSLSDIKAYLEKKGENISEYEWPDKVQSALDQGITMEQIDKYNQKKFIQEMDASQFAEHPGTPTDLPTIDGSMNYSKLPTETIKEIAIEIEADPSTPMGIDAIYQEAMYKKHPEMREVNQKIAEEYFVEQARADMTDIIEYNDFDQPARWARSILQPGAAHEVYLQKKQRIAENVIKTGAEYGYDLVLGQGQMVGDRELQQDEWYINVNGNYYEATPGFLASMSSYTGEIGGGILGFEYARMLIGSAGAIPGGKFGQFAILTAGTAAGAMLGDQIDYASAAVRMHKDYNWAVAADKAMGAAQAAVFGEVLGQGLWKVGAASWKFAARAYNLLVDGNVEGSYKILLETLELTDAQAKELVDKWEALNRMEAPTMTGKKPWWDVRKYGAMHKDKEKAIAVLTPARAGGEHVINQAIGLDPEMSSAVIAEINKRAKSVSAAVNAEVGPAGTRGLITDITDAIDGYVAETGAWYSRTKQRGGDLAPKHYSWDMEDLSIDPIIRSLVEDIADDTKRRTALNRFKRLDDKTLTRTFEDLIDLRQLVNQLRGVRTLKRADQEVYQVVMNNIDDEIMSVADRMGPEGDQWLKDWEDAKASYSQMKTLTENALGKIFKRPLVQENTVKGAQVAARALVDYGTALDGSYTRLLKELPLEAQPKVEMLIIDHIVNKHMVGDPTGKQAIIFPNVARELADYEFIWPNSKELVKVIDTFGEVYQNDVALSAIAGGLPKVDVTNFLTTDLAKRGQFVLMNRVWAQMRMLMGGAKGDVSSLANITAKLLRDPLNPKNVEDALKLAKEDATLETAIKKFQADTAAAKHADIPAATTTKVKTYKDNNGTVWTKPGTGRKEADAIPMHRMIDKETALTIARTDDLDNLGPVEKARLLNAGFSAIGLDDGSIIILN